MQERLWSQARSGRPYGLNVAMRWLVTGRLTQDVAQRALQALVDRHEILRTCLREVDGMPKQLILAACPIKLRSIDLTALDGDAAMARAEEIAARGSGRTDGPWRRRRCCAPAFCALDPTAASCC